MDHRYRKKPVIIEAFQMTRARREDNSEWPEWLNEAWQKDRDEDGALYIFFPPSRLLAIRTLEGDHVVSWADWIIRGVKGELYPCKPDIFEATYEPVKP